MKTRAIILATIAALLAAALLAGLVTRAALAAPPPNADPQLAPWFQGLSRPDQPGLSCCSEADCRIYTDDKVRLRDGNYEVFTEGDWRPVPPKRVNQRISNPTGGSPN